jgi:hypothetical protein
MYPHVSGQHYGRLDLWSAGREQRAINLPVVEAIAWHAVFR